VVDRQHHDPDPGGRRQELALYRARVHRHRLVGKLAFTESCISFAPPTQPAPAAAISQPASGTPKGARTEGTPRSIRKRRTGNPRRRRESAYFKPSPPEGHPPPFLGVCNSTPASLSHTLEPKGGRRGRFHTRAGLAVLRPLSMARRRAPRVTQPLRGCRPRGMIGARHTPTWAAESSSQSRS
jgi:hypothetical protein